MIISKKINMDLQQPSCSAVVNGVQNDRYSRNLELTLFSGGEVWTVPENVSVLVRYSKSDGTGGEYDTLPDGSQCWSASENVLTVTLAPQVFTAPGPVHLSVTLILGERQLSTFAVLLNVQKEVGGDIEESENYFPAKGFLPAPPGGEAGQYLRISAVDGSGHVTAVDAVAPVENLQLVQYTEQELTYNEKKQARDNIGATTIAEVVAALEGSTGTANLLAGVTWKTGYLTKNEINNDLSSQMFGEAYTEDIIEVTAGETYVFKYRFIPYNSSSAAWWAIHAITADGTVSRTVLPLTNVTEEGSVSVYTAQFTAGSSITGIRFCGRTSAWYGNMAGQGKTQEECDAIVDSVAPNVFSMLIAGTEESTTTGNMRLLPEVGNGQEGYLLQINEGQWTAAVPERRYCNPHVKAVNHRGYCTVAPENTLSAYRLSKKMGFAYVECDVSFTSDGAAVLLHDTTVDRTSNGTGDISALTLAQVQALDFGSWKGEDYAGERIPTFEEFVILCKQLGLYPYIEIKGNVTAEAAAGLVATVRRYGLQSQVTWISFYADSLANVKAADPSARLGYIAETASEAVIAAAMGLLSEENAVFLDLAYAAVTEDFVELCAEKGLPLEVWTVNSEDTILQLDAYISGYTSDKLRADALLYHTYG